MIDSQRRQIATANALGIYAVPAPIGAYYMIDGSGRRFATVAQAVAYARRASY